MTPWWWSCWRLMFPPSGWCIWYMDACRIWSSQGLRPAGWARWTAWVVNAATYSCAPQGREDIYVCVCVEIVILNAMCLWLCWWRMNKLRRLGAFAVSPLWSLDISWCVLYDCVKYFHYTRRVTSKHGVRSKSDCQLFVSTVFFSNHAVIQASTAV